MVAPEHIESGSKGYWSDVDEGEDLVSIEPPVGEATGIVIPDMPDDHRGLLAMSALGLLGVATAIAASRYVKHRNTKED